MTRVLQISDTHLSPTKTHFAANWPTLIAWATEQRPDLIIHTGDVSVDGADQEDDLHFCASIFKDLPAPVLTVPGNHDVGEAYHPHQPVNQNRLERWRRTFGADWWSQDVENWRLLGLNSMLFGSDLPDEDQQLAWLRAAMADASGRRIAWFTHKPLFLDGPDEADTGYWSVKPKPRKALLDLVRAFDVALVATGHLHKSHDMLVDGCRYIWGASSGFVVGPEMQPPMPGECRLGSVVYDFAGSDTAITRADVPGLTTYWIDDVVHEVYPPPQAA